MTKREQLQAIVNNAIKQNPDYCSFLIEWRGGWWAIPREDRYVGDRGEFLGYNFKQAKNTLTHLLP